MLFWLSVPQTLVVGDVILGDAQGGLSFCPESWLRIELADLSSARGPVLLELPVERVLSAHGDLILGAGHAALVRLFEAI